MLRFAWLEFCDLSATVLQKSAHSLSLIEFSISRINPSQAANGWRRGHERTSQSGTTLGTARGDARPRCHAHHPFKSAAEGRFGLVADFGRDGRMLMLPLLKSSEAICMRHFAR